MKSYIYYILLLIIGCSVCTSLQSCKDELKGIDQTSDKEQVEVIFAIPDENPFEFTTRAEDQKDADASDIENTFNNIYLLAANVADADGNSITGDDNFKIYTLTNKESSLTSKYRKYGISFTPGKYRFYVVVNLDDYLENGESVATFFKSESQLQSFLDNFNPTHPLNINNLPMACYATEVERDNNTITSGVITISSNSTNEITAPLTFLCAKVRYTILFDATKDGISKGFGDKRIRFDVNNEELPFVYNLGFSDVTSSYISNPRFNNNDKSGWIHEGTDNFNGVQFNIAEHYYKTFNTYQEHSEMPSGYYLLKVQGFYRAGNWNALEKHKDHSEKLYAHLYIAEMNGEKESGDLPGVPLMCLYDEESQGYSGAHGYPFSMKEASEAFNKGLYKKNSVSYKLENDNATLRFGIMKNESNAEDWTIFDNFQLYYKPLESDKDIISLGRYTWDPSEQKNYPTSASDILDPFDDSLDTWYEMPTKAWQGVAYLPENLSADSKTVLHFPYCYGNQTTSNGKEKTITLFDKDNVSDPQYNQNEYRSGLKRGMMYDIRIQVIKSDQEEDEFILYVTVKNWDYKPSEKEL